MPHHPLPRAHLFLSHGLCLLIMKRSHSPFDPEDTWPMILLFAHFVPLRQSQHLCCDFSVDDARPFHHSPFCTVSYLTIHSLARKSSFPIAHLRRIEQLIKLECFLLSKSARRKHLMAAHKLEAATLAFRVHLKPLASCG